MQITIAQPIYAVSSLLSLIDCEQLESILHSYYIKDCFANPRSNYILAWAVLIPKFTTTPSTPCSTKTPKSISEASSPKMTSQVSSNRKTQQVTATSCSLPQLPLTLRERTLLDHHPLLLQVRLSSLSGLFP